MHLALDQLSLVIWHLVQERKISPLTQPSEAILLQGISANESVCGRVAGVQPRPSRWSTRRPSKAAIS